MKPGRSNPPSSDTIYHGTVNIPYVRDTSKKIQTHWEPLRYWEHFKNWTYTPWNIHENWTVRDAQQKKKCVYIISCDYDRCCIGETSIPLETRIEEHKDNLRQGMLEKLKLVQRAYEEDHKKPHNVSEKAKVLQIEPNTSYRNLPTGLWLLIRSVNRARTRLPSGLPLLQQKSENHKFVQFRLCGKVMLCISTTQITHLSLCFVFC
jgi:predicted GIY-YIG superfamily endonuclease